MIELLFQTTIGILFFFLVLASKYIVTGRFKFKIWREENLMYMIWSLAVAIVAALIGLVEPLAIDAAFGQFGITVARLEGGEFSGTLLGIAIAFASKTIIKPMRKVKIIRDGASVEVIEEGSVDSKEYTAEQIEVIKKK